MLQFTIYFGAEPADGRDGLRRPKSKSPARQGRGNDRPPPAITRIHGGGQIDRRPRARRRWRACNSFCPWWGRRRGGGGWGSGRWGLGDREPEPWRGFQER